MIVDIVVGPLVLECHQWQDDHPFYQVWIKICEWGEFFEPIASCVMFLYHRQCSSTGQSAVDISQTLYMDDTKTPCIPIEIIQSIFVRQLFSSAVVSFTLMSFNPCQSVNLFLEST